jgi:hypothetical protein
VSRQREWLADASAGQFTRQTTGLAGALKKIAGLPTGSALANASVAREVSHMLFGEGGHALSQLFATHPPLMKRITALDPAFDRDEVATLSEKWHADPPNGLSEDAALGLSGPPARSPVPVPAKPQSVRVAPADVSGRVGTLLPEDLDHGAHLSSQIAPELRQLATQASTVVPLVLGLVLDANPGVRAAQLNLVNVRIGAAEAAAATALADQFATLPPQLRLPLVHLAAPLITAAPARSLDILITTLDDMARVDKSISVFEYCTTRLIAGYIRDARQPARRSRVGRGSIRQAESPVFTLLAAVAATGNDDRTAAQRAFAAAVAVLWPGVSVPYQPPTDLWWALDTGWAKLDALDPADKQRLVEALVTAIRDDGDFTLNEAELLRTACALLHCPLPAFAA